MSDDEKYENLAGRLALFLDIAGKRNPNIRQVLETACEKIEGLHYLIRPDEELPCELARYNSNKKLIEIRASVFAQGCSVLNTAGSD